MMRLNPTWKLQSNGSNNNKMLSNLGNNEPSRLTKSAESTKSKSVDTTSGDMELLDPFPINCVPQIMPSRASSWKYPVPLLESAILIHFLSHLTDLPQLVHEDSFSEIAGREVNTTTTLGA